MLLWFEHSYMSGKRTAMRMYGPLQLLHVHHPNLASYELFTKTDTSGVAVASAFPASPPPPHTHTRTQLPTSITSLALCVRPMLLAGWHTQEETTGQVRRWGPLTHLNVVVVAVGSQQWGHNACCTAASRRPGLLLCARVSQNNEWPQVDLQGSG
jgi:hypothetical protein